MTPLLFATEQTMCLASAAAGEVELVEALSIRAPLPDSAPVEWKQLLGRSRNRFT